MPVAWQHVTSGLTLLPLPLLSNLTNPDLAPATLALTPASPAPQCRATAQVYQQCGGLSCQFKGLCSDSVWAACAQGNCVRKSEYYW